jgi:hypothetical protein
MRDLIALPPVGPVDGCLPAVRDGSTKPVQHEHLDSDSCASGANSRRVLRLPTCIQALPHTPVIDTAVLRRVRPNALPNDPPAVTE